MKICIVGPGMMPIPPVGWGAVEILIWDTKLELEKLGHDVKIVNTPNRGEIINEVNAFHPDFVHIHYDEYFDIEPYIECSNIAITSHYGYLEQPDKYDHGYWRIFQGFLNLQKTKIFALSQGIADRYISSGFPANRVFVVPNGVRTDLFHFDENCEKPNSSICLGKIESRKRQYLIQHIPDVYFAGGLCDPRYQGHNYLGEWSKDFLYQNLTKYANLVLLSDGEAHPLVCMEAMAAGLGLVVSESASGNLDTRLSFIDVIPESKMTDLNYIKEVIVNNRSKSYSVRSCIRLYAQSHSWDEIIKKYYLPNT